MTVSESSSLAAFDIMSQPRNAHQRDRFLNDCDLVLRDMIRDMRRASAGERRCLQPILKMYERRFFEVEKVHVALGH